MINWELPHEKVPCPHCGSTDTQLSLQLLGVTRYTCTGCKKSFATHDGARLPKPAAQSSATTS